MELYSRAAQDVPPSLASIRPSGHVQISMYDKNRTARQGCHLLRHTAQQQASQLTMPAAAEDNQVGRPGIGKSKYLLRRVPNRYVGRDAPRSLCRCPVAGADQMLTHRPDFHHGQRLPDMLDPSIGFQAWIRLHELASDDQQHQFCLGLGRQIGSDVDGPQRCLREVNRYNDAFHTERVNDFDTSGVVI